MSDGANSEPIVHAADGGNGATVVTRAELRTMANNVLLERAQFFRQHGITFGGLRDLYSIFGYDDIITNQQYRNRYARGGIAGRVVDAMPNATWRGTVELIEDEDPDKITPFEQAWMDLDQRLQIQAKLRRVDKLAGLSTYAVLLIGAGGELDAELPKGGPEQLLYLTPFGGGGGPSTRNVSTPSASDADCTIKEFDIDPQSPRFGLPQFYQLRRTDVSSPALMRPVHWSRIVHIAENLLDDEVYGLPTLERIWNLLDDLDKVTGGGAEAFFLRANQGLHIDIDKDMSLESAKDTIDALKEQSENYKHQMTRWLRTRGASVETLGSDVANFANPAEAVLTQIAGATAIPKRILTGSEMGELASSQDRDNWKDQVNGRQTGYAGPYIVRPLVDRLVAYGYLPTPKDGALSYEVRWPHIQTLTETEKVTGAQGWATVNASQGSVVFTDAEIREKWADKAPLTDQQKKEIADAAAEKVKQAQEMMKAQTPAEPVGARFPRAAETVDASDEELIRVLQSAIECGATAVVHAIIGLGSEASGNYAHAGRPGEVGGSTPSAATIAARQQAVGEFNRLKGEWARINDGLLSHLNNPDSPIAQKMIREQKEICKQIQQLEVNHDGTQEIGLPGKVRDVLIVGAGPGGLSAAASGGMEGLNTLVIDADTRVGGQPKYSSRIENYPGFPAGASGQQISASMREQAERLGAEVQTGVRAESLVNDPTTGIKSVTLSNGEVVQARSVILATGVKINKAQFPGSEEVLYNGPAVASRAKGGAVVIAGGSNGAAQAALGAAQSVSHVTLVSRSPLTDGMSDTQRRAITNHPKITVLENEEISSYDAAAGKVVLKSGAETSAAAVGVFFGGTPQTAWLPQDLKREGKRIAVNTSLETSIPGVFAIGDARPGPGTGRIGTAVGDGLVAVRGAFDYFARTSKKVKES